MMLIETIHRFARIQVSFSMTKNRPAMRTCAPKPTYGVVATVTLGSITSRFSGNEPALLSRMGKVDQTRESGGNRAY